MRNLLFFLIILLFTSLNIHANDKTSSRQLTRHEIDSILTDNVKKEFDIRYDVFKSYEYNDKLGKHYIFFTERKYKVVEDKVLTDSIKAFVFLVKEKALELEREITDFIIGYNPAVKETEESIWFWTKYVTFKDFDGDGLIEPVIIYGSSCNITYGMDYGRVKIITLYKGNKIVIKHQNYPYDGGYRETIVDKPFYDIPKLVQEGVKEVMEKMSSKSHAVYSADWKKYMDEKRLKFTD